jgi:hypothetical protein
MELPLNIYVFQLEFDHLFVYPTRRIDPAFEDLALEITLYYDFVKKYPPIRIIETMYDQPMMMVDATVKKYMLFFDFIIVRGGTYYMEILPDYLQKSLKDELAFISFIDLPNIDFIENLMLLKDRTADERAKLRVIFANTLEQYRKEKKIQEDLYQFEAAAGVYIIDENVLVQIGKFKEWILQRIASTGDVEEISFEFSEIYPVFLIYLRRLYAIVLKYNYNIRLLYDITEQEMVFIKNPEFVFDNFVYTRKLTVFERETTPVDACDMAIRVCEYYESICQKVLNMIDEYTFDVGLYETQFEWKYERAIYYMDWLDKHPEYGETPPSSKRVC